MNIRAESLSLSRVRPALNRFALIFIFVMANFTGRFEPQLLSSAPGLARWSIVLSLAVVSALSGVIFVVFTQTAENYLDRAHKKNITSFLIVAAGLFLILLFLWAVNPLVSKISGLDFAPQFHNVSLLVIRMLVGALLFTWIFRYETQILARLRFVGGLVKRLEKNQEQLIEAEEQQRTQASRFLHDRVQAELMVVSLQIANIEKKLAKAEAAELAASRARLEKLRRVDLKAVSNSLTPNIEEFGLAFCVDELMAQFAADMKVEIQIDAQPLADNEFLQLGIYRIIEQAVVNSITHGPAPHLSISVSMTSKFDCTLVIADDGPGVSTEEIEAGFGTVLIDSWVSILKATKIVSSKPGMGFTLTVTIPL